MLLQSFLIDPDGATLVNITTAVSMMSWMSKLEMLLDFLHIIAY